MDTIGRLAVNDRMTPEEASACARLQDICGDSALFVLISAVFRRADREGIRVNLSLTRKKVSRVSERKLEIGLTERYLRSDNERITNGSHRIYAGALANLQKQGCTSPDWEDIMSEAIEAAEALGL